MDRVAPQAGRGRWAVFDDIVRSWERWAGSRGGRHRLDQWADAHPALAGWSRQALGAPVSSPRTDAMQAALVALSQAGDEAAGRTLIVQLRPGLVSVVWRSWHRRRAGVRPFASLAEAEAEGLSAFGETLARHRLDRRPERIAANLLLDTHQRLWRAEGRDGRDGRLAADGVAPPEGAGGTTDPVDGALDLVAAVTSALDQLTGTVQSRRLTAELAYRAWILDEPSVLIARELGLARKTVDTRLCRLRAAVRRASALELALDPDRAGAPPGRAGEGRAGGGPGRQEPVAVSRSDGSAPPSSPVGPSRVSLQ